MRSPVADLLADLSRAFEALQLPWYLFGAQAAIVYGAARLTADVDVTVRPQAHTIPHDWLTVLERHGFEPRFGNREFFEQTRVWPLLHRATGLPTDLVLAGPGLEDEFLSRAVMLDIDGVNVPVIEIADLVVLKVLAGRPKDVEDVVALLRAQRDTVDHRRVREVLALLESALGMSDLLPRFEEALQRSGRR